MLTIPVLWTQPRNQSRLRQHHLGVQHDLCAFVTSAPTPSFLQVYRSTSVAKWTVLHSFRAFWSPLSCCWLFVTCHAGTFSSLFHSLSTAAIASRIFTSWQDCCDTTNWTLLSNKIIMISLLSRFNARSRVLSGFDDTGVSCPSSVGMFITAGFTGQTGAAQFARHSRFQRYVQLVTHVFHGVLELHAIPIDVIDRFQFSSIVEFRLFKSPILLFLFFDCFAKNLTALLAKK